MKQKGSRHDAPHAVKKLRGLWLYTVTGMCAMLFTACDISPQQSFVADVNAMTWQQTATVTMRNTDTLGVRTLHIVVRSNEQLNRDTLTLHIATLSPDSVLYEEPFRLHIPRPAKATSLRREANIAYRKEVVLADTGIYHFSFTPTRAIRGIEAIGIHIENN